jgi:hypothetical protein
MGDYDLIVLCIGGFLFMSSLTFCCHYWQMYSILRMYQNAHRQQELLTYIPLPSAPPLET